MCRVHVQSKPLDIVYNPATISRLKHFVTTPHGGHGTVVKLSQQIQHQTTAGLRNKLGDILEGDTTVRSHALNYVMFTMNLYVMLAKYTPSYFVCVCVCACVCVRGGSSRWQRVLKHPPALEKLFVCVSLIGRLKTRLKSLSDLVLAG